MDLQFTEEQNALRDSVRKMMDRLATPEYVRRLDQEQTYPYELYQGWDCMLSGLQYERCVAVSAYVGGAQNALKEISMAKLFASETYVKVANQGMQIFGAAGYSMEYDMQRYFRDARGSTIAGGTSQMQRNLIARLMDLRVN